MFELPSGAEIQGIIASLKASVGFFIPEIYLSVLFMLLIVIDLVAKGRKNNLLSITTLLGLAGSTVFIYQQHALPAGELFFGHETRPLLQILFCAFRDSRRCCYDG